MVRKAWGVEWGGRYMLVFLCQIRHSTIMGISLLYVIIIESKNT